MSVIVNLPNDIKCGVVSHIVRYDLLRRQEFRNSVLSTIPDNQFWKRAGTKSQALWDAVVARLEAQLFDRPMASTEIHLVTGMSRSTAGRCVRILSELGIFLLRTDPGDHRRILIDLSEPSKAVLYKYVNECFEEFKDLISHHHDRERTKAQNALHEYEVRWQSLVEESPDLVILLDTDLRIQFTNHPMSGLSPEDVKGNSILEYVSEENRRSIKSALETVVETGAPASFETTIRHRDEVRQIEMRVVSRAIDSLVVGLTVHGRDITDRKWTEVALRQSEARFRALFEHANAAINIKDSNGRFILTNQKYKERHSLDDRIEEGGKTVFDLHDHDYAEFVVATDRKVIETGEPITFEQQISLADGSVSICILNKFPIPGPTSTEDWVGTVTTDVTGLRAAERKLAYRDIQLRAVFDEAEDLITIKDQNLRYVEANQKFCDSTGISREQLIGKSDLNLFPPEEATVILDIDQSVLRGETVRMDFKSLRRNREIIVDLTKFPLRNSDGEIIGVCGISRDVTEHRNLERSIEESNARLQAILDNAPWPITLKDIEGRLQVFNQAYPQTICVQAEELIGKTAYDLHPATVAKEITSQEKLVVESGKAKVFNVIRQYSNTSERHLVAVRFPVKGSDARVVGVGGITVDMTERHALEQEVKRSNAVLQAILDNSPWAINLKDTEGRLIVCNAAYAQRFGESAPNLIGKRTQELYLNYVADEIIEQENAVLESHKTQVYEVVRRYRNTGDRQLMAVRFPVLGGDSRIIGIGNISVDITEQRMLEDMLREARQMQSIGFLTGGVAHEFNNLLQGMRSYLEVLKGRCANEQEAGPIIDRLFAQEERGATLVRRLLAFAGKQILTSRRTDPNAVMGELTELLGRTLNRNIKIVQNLESNLPPVFIDVASLRDAVLNIAMNAQLAMPKGGSLTIETGLQRRAKTTTIKDHTLPSGEYVEIRITDTGCGMPEDVRERAISPFFTTRDVGEGQGLGLSMAYGFCRQSGGHLELESAVGRGTTVRILLPALSGEEAKSQMPRKKTKKMARILVVDDDADVRKSTRALVASFGHHVYEAENATKALQILETTPSIDVLITDIVMPQNLDGIELAKRAEKIKRDLKILLVSGYPDSAISESAGSRYSFLRKPYSVKDLNIELERLLTD